MFTKNFLYKRVSPCGNQNIVLAMTETELSTPKQDFPLNDAPIFPWSFLPTSTVQERSWKLIQWEGSLVIQAIENKKEKWSLEKAKDTEIVGSAKWISSLL